MHTTEFLEGRRVIGEVTHDSWLVTIDKVSLHTSIEHSMGMRAARKLLEDNTYTQEQRKFIMEMLEIVLCENYFFFKTNLICRRGERQYDYRLYILHIGGALGIPFDVFWLVKWTFGWVKIYHYIWTNKSKCLDSQIIKMANGKLQTYIHETDE